MIRALSIFITLALGTTLLIAATDDGAGLESAREFIVRAAWADASIYH